MLAKIHFGWSVDGLFGSLILLMHPADFLENNWSSNSSFKVMADISIDWNACCGAFSLGMLCCSLVVVAFNCGDPSIGPHVQITYRPHLTADAFF